MTCVECSSGLCHKHELSTDLLESSQANEVYITVWIFLVLTMLLGLPAESVFLYKGT